MTYDPVYKNDTPGSILAPSAPHWTSSPYTNYSWSVIHAHMIRDDSNVTPWAEALWVSSQRPVLYLINL